MRIKINDFIMAHHPGDNIQKVPLDEDDNPVHEFSHMYDGLPVIANNNRRETKTGMGYFNNERFEIKSYDDDKITFTDGRELETKIFHKQFRPAYATTVHKSQGLTISEPYAIYQLNKQDKYSIYTAFTRTANPNLINIVTRPSFDIVIPDPMAQFSIPLRPETCRVPVTTEDDLVTAGQRFFYTKDQALGGATGDAILISREVRTVTKPKTFQYTPFKSY